MRRILLIFLVLASTNVSHCQSIYVEGATLSIGSGALLFVPDSIVNNGTIINNGDIQINGLWQNNASYQPGTGQLTLASNQPQVINHNDQSFTRLTISGGGQKTFGADIHIVNELDMNNGILVSSGNAKIIIEDGAAIVGGSVSSYIDGLVYHVGNGDKYFPVGNSSEFLPVELTDVKGSNPTIGVLIKTPNPNTSISGGLSAVSSKQYWQLDVLNGTFTGSPVILPVVNETLLDSIQQAVVAQASTFDAPYESLGQAIFSGNTLSGTVTSSLEATDLFLTVGKVVSEPGTTLNIFNAVSSNGDGINDFFKIINIESFPENVVTIYNRWGDKIFNMKGYNNSDKIFNGLSNVGGQDKLIAGTYYYVIDKGDGSKKVTGFLVLRY